VVETVKPIIKPVTCECGKEPWTIKYGIWVELVCKNYKCRNLVLARAHTILGATLRWNWKKRRARRKGKGDAKA